MKTCPSCGAEAPDDARTCGVCEKSFDQPDAVATAAAAPPPEAPLAPAARESGLTACPQCKAAWQPGAVVCVSCGYDARIGRRLSTVHGVEDEPPIVRPTRGLEPVRQGLFLQLIVVSLWLLSIPLSIIFAVQRAELVQMVEVRADADLQQPVLVAAWVMAAALIAFAALQWLLGLIGSILCLWMPRESGARAPLVASLVLAAAIVPVHIAVVMQGWHTAVLALLWLPAWIAWMIALRNMAYYLQRREEAQEAVGIIVHMLIILFLIPGVGFPALFLAVLWMISVESLACIGFIVGMGVGTLAFIGWLIYYVRVLFDLFRVIATLRQELLPRPSGKDAASAGVSEE